LQKEAELGLRITEDGLLKTQPGKLWKNNLNFSLKTDSKADLSG